MIRTRLAALVATTAAAALGLSALAPSAADARPAAPSAPPAAQPSDAPRPTAAARRAGVQPGNAEMGWSQRAAAASESRARTAAPKITGVLGLDVSSWQGNVNWAAHKARGRSFVYVKATESTRYRNPYFSAQFNGAGQVGMLRGAYHFAIPSSSSGYTQANYFVDRGGAWKSRTNTLPGVLDIEYNPYGKTCYGLSKTAMVNWITAFVTQYKKRTGRDAVIYTTTDWWTRCTGNTSKFSLTNPLWIARYGTSTPGTLPGKWSFYTFWQYSSSPIDQNKFSAPYARLQILAG